MLVVFIIAVATTNLGRFSTIVDGFYLAVLAEIV